MVDEQQVETKRQQSIVVVDDSPTSRRFASDALTAAGFEVLTANDGEEAIELVNRSLPSVVVLDIILPKKNGFQVCRELKTSSHTKDIQIVLLSSKSQESDRFWGQRQGADAYLTKPVNPDELRSIVCAMAANITSEPINESSTPETSQRCTTK